MDGRLVTPNDLVSLMSELLAVSFRPQDHIISFCSSSFDSTSTVLGGTFSNGQRSSCSSVGRYFGSGSMIALTWNFVGLVEAESLSQSEDLRS